MRADNKCLTQKVPRIFQSVGKRSSRQHACGVRELVIVVVTLPTALVHLACSPPLKREEAPFVCRSLCSAMDLLVGPLSVLLGHCIMHRVATAMSVECQSGTFPLRERRRFSSHTFTQRMLLSPQHHHRPLKHENIAPLLSFSRSCGSLCDSNLDVIEFLKCGRPNLEWGWTPRFSFPRLAVGTNESDEQSSEHRIEEDRGVASRATGRNVGCGRNRWALKESSGNSMHRRFNVQYDTSQRHPTLRCHAHEDRKHNERNLLRLNT